MFVLLSIVDLLPMSTLHAFGVLCPEDLELRLAGLSSPIVVVVFVTRGIKVFFCYAQFRFRERLSDLPQRSSAMGSLPLNSQLSLVVCRKLVKYVVA